MSGSSWSVAGAAGAGTAAGAGRNTAGAAVWALAQDKAAAAGACPFGAVVAAICSSIDQAMGRQTKIGC